MPREHPFNLFTVLDGTDLHHVNFLPNTQILLILKLCSKKVNRTKLILELRDWVGPRAGLNTVASGRKISCPCRELKPGCPAQ